MADGCGRESMSLSTLQARLTHAFSDPDAQKQFFVCLLIAVCVITLLVHSPSLSSRALLYDDQYYVTQNALVQSPSWASARRFLAEVWNPSTVPGYYHPLSMISLMIDRLLAGPDDSLRVYHRTSLLLHIANTALLAILLYILFPQPFTAAAVALLFGLHPITVDSVCWLSERKTVLSSFFALWSLIAYVKFTRERKARLYIACVVTYVLALLSKPIALPLPFMMFLLDYWPLARLRWRSVMEKSPLFGVTAIFTVVGYISQLHSGWIRLPGQYNPLEAPLVLSHNIVFYVCKLLCPTNMSPHYEPPEHLAFSDPTIILSMAGTFLLVLVIIASLRWTRAVFAGWLIAFVMLFPACGIVSHSVTLVANRYLYLPFASFLVLPAWILLRACQGRARHWWRVAIFTSLLALASAETVATRQYLRPWSDTHRLYTYMLSMFPRSGTLQNDLGVALKMQGRPGEAVDHFRFAIRADPRFYRAYYNLAVTLDESGGQNDQVVRNYRKALLIAPWYVPAHLNLGSVLSRTGNSREALASLEKAANVAPGSPLVHYNYGTMLIVSGRPEEGLSHLRQALEIDPGFFPAMKGLAWFLATHPNAKIRNPNEATRLAERMRAVTGDSSVTVLDTLAAAYASAGQFDKAAEAAHLALRIATRQERHKAVEQIGKRFDLYQIGQPYYEAPHVQSDMVLTEGTKEKSGNYGAGVGYDPKSRFGIRDAESKAGELEVQDEAEDISAE